MRGKLLLPSPGCLHSETHKNARHMDAKYAQARKPSGQRWRVETGGKHPHTQKHMPVMCLAERPHRRTAPSSAPPSPPVPPRASAPLSGEIGSQTCSRGPELRAPISTRVTSTSYPLFIEYASFYFLTFTFMCVLSFCIFDSTGFKCCEGKLFLTLCM